MLWFGLIWFVVVLPVWFGLGRFALFLWLACCSLLICWFCLIVLNWFDLVCVSMLFVWFDCGLLCFVCGMCYFCID